MKEININLTTTQEPKGSFLVQGDEHISIV